MARLPDDKGAYTSEEVSILIRFAACAEDVTFVLLGALAGLQPREVVRLRWPDVGVEAGTLTLFGEVVPNADALVTALSAHANAFHGDARVFAFDTARAVDLHLRAACRAARVAPYRPWRALRRVAAQHWRRSAHDAMKTRARFGSLLADDSE